jgi:ketosteroid isomerase-like protein
MAGNVEVLRGGYDAFKRGDMDAVRETWHDDIRWEAPNYDKLPGSGVHEGKDAVTQMVGEFVQFWDEVTVTADEFIEQGDTVVALGHTEGRVNGNDVKVPFVHIWRLRDGKVERAQSLTDTAEVAEAAGVLASA